MVSENDIEELSDYQLESVNGGFLFTAFIVGIILEKTGVWKPGRSSWLDGLSRAMQHK